MLDVPVRRAIAPTLEAGAAHLQRWRISPLAITVAGWLLGVSACLAGATGHWTPALILWLLNRLFDGLDGPLARRTGASDLGGFLDVLADFSIYAGFVVAVGIDRPEARIACLVLLTAYYVSGTAFLALSSILERRRASGDGRSLLFVGGLAEGTETVLAYCVFCLFPQHAETIAWVFAGAVAITALQRIHHATSVLRIPHSPQENP